MYEATKSVQDKTVSHKEVLFKAKDVLDFINPSIAMIH